MGCDFCGEFLSWKIGGNYNINIDMQEESLSLSGVSLLEEGIKPPKEKYKTLGRVLCAGYLILPFFQDLPD